MLERDKTTRNASSRRDFLAQIRSGKQGSTASTHARTQERDSSPSRLFSALLAVSGLSGRPNPSFSQHWMNETLDEKQEDEHVHIVESIEICILCTIHLYIRIRIRVCV
jgi:hypothetical protein